MANGLPTFAAGEFYKIQAAIDVGVLTYPSYVYIRDERKLAFIDQDLSINRIIGDNEEQVVSVETLPSVEEAKKNVLYILDGIVYAFNGTDFTPQYKDVTSDIEQLKIDLKNLTDRVDVLENAQSPIVWIEL